MKIQAAGRAQPAAIASEQARTSSKATPKPAPVAAQIRPATIEALMRDYPVTGKVPIPTRAGILPNAFHVEDGQGTRVNGTADAAAVLKALKGTGLAPVMVGEGQALMNVWVMRYDKTNMPNPKDAKGGYDEIILNIPVVRGKAVHANNIQDGLAKATDIYMYRVELNSLAPMESGIVGAGLDKHWGGFKTKNGMVQVDDANGKEILRLGLTDAGLPVEGKTTRVDLGLTNPDVLAPNQLVQSKIGIVAKSSTRDFGPGDVFTSNPATSFGRDLSRFGFKPAQIERLDDIGIAVMSKETMGFRSIAARLIRGIGTIVDKFT